jgi:hypothetical protein
MTGLALHGAIGGTIPTEMYVCFVACWPQLMDCEPFPAVPVFVGCRLVLLCTVDLFALCPCLTSQYVISFFEIQTMFDSHSGKLSSLEALSLAGSISGTIPIEMYVWIVVVGSASVVRPCWAQRTQLVKLTCFAFHSGIAHVMDHITPPSNGFRGQLPNLVRLLLFSLSLTGTIPSEL